VLVAERRSLEVLEEGGYGGKLKRLKEKIAACVFPGGKSISPIPSRRRSSSTDVATTTGKPLIDCYELWVGS